MGVYLSVTNWDAPSALSESTAFRQYLIFFYAEFVLAGAGAFVLIKRKRKDYVAPWIAFIVGIHFIGLKSVFADASLYLLSLLLVGISLLALPLSRKWQVASSAITGIGVGTVLFAYALLGLIRYGMV